MIPIIGSIIQNVTGLVNKIVPDRDLAQKITSDITKQMLDENAKIIQSEIENQAQVIIAEAKGESAIQRNWRPILMLVFTFIIFNNYVLAPYLKCFWDSVPTLTLPDEMWALLKLGVGGYVAGRSVEKVIANWKGK